MFYDFFIFVNANCCFNIFYLWFCYILASLLCVVSVFLVYDLEQCLFDCSCFPFALRAVSCTKIFTLTGELISDSHHDVNYRQQRPSRVSWQQTWSPFGTFWEVGGWESRLGVRAERYIRAVSHQATKSITKWDEHGNAADRQRCIPLQACWAININRPLRRRKQQDRWWAVVPPPHPQPPHPTETIAFRKPLANFISPSTHWFSFRRKQLSPSYLSITCSHATHTEIPSHQQHHAPQHPLSLCLKRIRRLCI